MGSLDVQKVFLIAQTGAEVFALGKVAVEDLMTFLHSQGLDHDKINELRVGYAEAIAAEEAEIAKASADITPAPSV